MSNASAQFPERFYRGMIAIFASHRVAANLLMVLMIIFGLYSLSKLSRQMFPDFDFEYITVVTPWVGASPEDVEASLTLPIEREVKDVAGLKSLNSYSTFGMSSIYLEFKDGVEIQKTLADVKQRVETIQNLPSDAEDPIIKNLDSYSQVMNLLVYTDGAKEELLPVVRKIEAGLLAGGAGDIKFDGLPKEEIAIEVERSRLEELNMSLSQVGQTIARNNIDFPAGTAGRDQGGRMVRVDNQRKTSEELRELPVINQGNSMVMLGDIAVVTQRLRDDLDYITYQGKPAIIVQLRGAKGQDAIRMADDVKAWLGEFEKTLPGSIHIVKHLEKWQLVKDRIATLVNNAGSGLILIVIVLFLFLNFRVAFWVGMGVPIALLGTMGMLWVFGSSLNLISLLGLLVALGIIVDDAIVVGEESLAQYQNGVPAREASIIGARRMFVPVMASSMTTIAAFLPTAMFSGAMGKIIMDIPLTIVAVLVASIIECFLILPGHLHHSLKKIKKEPSKFRRWFDRGFERFREGFFIPILKVILKFRWTTVAGAVMVLILSVATIPTGFLKWNFFPTADSSDIRASFKFTAGATEQQGNAFLEHLYQTLLETNDDNGGELLNFAYKQHRIEAGFENLGGSISSSGSAFGTLVVEMNVVDEQVLSNDDFIKAWRTKLILPPGIDEFSISKSPVGPPGKDLEFNLSYSNPSVLKAASLELQDTMRTFAGVTNVTDNMPYGGEQYILSLNAQGLAQGLNLSDVSAQMRAALDGVLVQRLNVGPEEIDVRVMLPDEDRRQLASIQNIPIMLPSKQIVSLSEVAEFEVRKGFQQLPRESAELSITVKADVDSTIANAGEIFSELKETDFPKLESKYGVVYKEAGTLKDNAQAQQDMMRGTLIAFVLMYIILAWVFSSYTWPIVIMSAIFLGISGAILGHIIVIRLGLLDISFSFLSAIGMFGLAGIIVNDSIILATFFKDKLEEGVEPYAAVLESCRKRLRPVILTSVTTIVGMIPILFETSIQAQFLKPMVISVAFGLLFGTILILMVVPALLMIIEGDRPRRKALYNRIFYK